MKIEGENEPNPSTPREEGLVPFVFVGTVEGIELARVLLEYHLAHLHEVRRPSGLLISASAAQIS